MNALDTPQGYADADAIATCYSRPTGSIYRLASTHNWRRLRWHGRTIYHLDDVDQTMTNPQPAGSLTR